MTAAHLMALRTDDGAADAIGELLGIAAMEPKLADRTKGEIERFLTSGDATVASQLIHAAMVRRKRPGGSSGAPEKSGGR